MGKKLGNALIIYGILNFLVSFAFGSALIIIGALIWMIIMIALGNWQRSKARAEKARDEQTRLLHRVTDRLDEEKLQRMADKLDEEGKENPKRDGIRYTKD